MVEHPITETEKFKEMLGSITEIKYTWHFERERLPYRHNVTKNLIEKHLNNPSDLLIFDHQKDSHRRHKYAAYFDKSTKYYLKIVLSVQDKKLYVVKAYIINRKRADLEVE
ncbi:MAG: hypothetical protein SVV03_00935 [Candidatus Nanohaloarchaea archaeon]|nr:hypothetical protein [Candidatus Nanohaloarchaea archaeon]